MSELWRPVVGYEGYYSVSDHGRVCWLRSFGPRPHGLMTLHNDDDPSNNHLVNLRYGTHKENRHDAVRNGGHAMSSVTCGSGHPFDADNTYTYRGKRLCKAAGPTGSGLAARNAASKSEGRTSHDRNNSAI
ncbi:HNH endonuclease [Mycobacterium kansasii]